MTKQSPELQAGYDRVAEHYATEYFDELKRKPFDRELLDTFAESVRDDGRVCELGCGPGQVARYLKDRGVDMCGLDLSGEMVIQVLREDRAGGEAVANTGLSLAVRRVYTAVAVDAVADRGAELISLREAGEGAEQDGDWEFE